MPFLSGGFVSRLHCRRQKYALRTRSNPATDKPELYRGFNLDKTPLAKPPTEAATFNRVCWLLKISLVRPGLLPGCCCR